MGRRDKIKIRISRLSRIPTPRYTVSCAMQEISKYEVTAGLVATLTVATNKPITTMPPPPPSPWTRMYPLTSLPHP